MLLLSSPGLTQPEIEAVRGVWLTNVDSEVLNSRENIIEAVELLNACNFNTIFVVVWNKGFTLYPSAVMKDIFNIPIDPVFDGRDPLKELIEEAHKRNIKVIAWFEFGFSTSYQLDGGHILEKKPEWASQNADGELVTKNGFDWMNGFHPDVQDFMLSLILEVVKNYDIDGIQGDDRLPAMPSEAGYDNYTVNLYKNKNGGNMPPDYHKDYGWITFRSSLMNDFMIRIYDEVKALDPSVVVAMAPSIYPWSEEEYLQDWNYWVNFGYCELVSPQLYRKSTPAYSLLIDDILSKQLVPEKQKLFYPGILLKVGDYYPSEELLAEFITTNRKYGIEGEVFFFYEGLKKYPDFFKKLYKEKAEFPNLLN